MAHERCSADLAAVPLTLSGRPKQLQQGPQIGGSASLGSVPILAPATGAQGSIATGAAMARAS